ncbi:hydroxyethylthiazole kinase [Paraburkholderia fungorum]|uniref:hydroxyethylthiazole kinase n=1 Tax=Paraburkholderia fungorum TaxID=134537 RepID=UPI0038B8E759
MIPDQDMCAAGMQECAPGNGAYPVSFNLGWHGGSHLIAPRDAHGTAAPVRAIADGTIVYTRQTDVTEKTALSYRGVRTDDGCVVIRHSTEIGEGEDAKVTFFSIYMHLQTVSSPMIVGNKVYRKDVIGIAGQIYGQLGQIHFEIVCNHANLRKLVGRTAGPLAAMVGRKDAIYGDIWFRVPKGTPVFENREPHPYRLDDREPPPCSTITPQAARTTQREYVIRMRYQKGECTLTTFQKDAAGHYAVFRSLPCGSGYEYDLYKEATRLSAKYVELNQAAGCAYATVPAPASIYEILRFGRTVGTDFLPTGSKFGHWRKITTPDATGWINLSLPGIGIYSDADFPDWAGWNLIDDDTMAKSLCNSPTIRRWLDLNGDGHVSHAEAVQGLHDNGARARLSTAICKFPIEWSKNEEAIEHRWGWLKESSESLHVLLSSDGFALLKAHIQALAFWEEIDDAHLPAADQCWHFPPKAFVEHFRKCGWLSANELAQCLPRRSLSGNMPWNVAFDRGSTHAKPINLIYRKYLNESRLRLLHFLAQVHIETDILRTMAEDSSGNGRVYGPFYGRGYLQLTWPLNYDAYSRYRSIPNNAVLSYADHRITATSAHIWANGGATQRWSPRFDPKIVATDFVHAAESSAMYWLAKTFRGKHNINRVADLGTSPAVVGFISWLVNGGGHGYVNRQQFASLLAEVLLDQPPRTDTGTLNYPPLSPPGNPFLCSTFPPAAVPSTQTVTVTYAAQKP